MTPPAGLVGWWPGNGTAGDASGSNPGTLQSYATYAPGRAGLAFSLNGAGGYVEVPDSPLWAFGSNSFTFELWANFAAAGNRVFVASDAGGGSHDKWLFWLNGGKLQFHVNDSTGDALSIGSASFSPTIGQWYHLALTRSGSNFTFYVDGSSVATNAAVRAIPDVSAPVTIGQAESNYYFNGLLDEVSVYNRALSAAEIAGIYNAGSAGKCGAAASGSGVPYFTDFENGIGPEWGVPLVNTNETLGFTAFTGRFANNSQSLVLTNLVPGQSYTLGFDFYAIDTWDGNSGDYFNVGVNGIQVFHETFANYNGEPPSNSQSFPRSPDEGRANFGFGANNVDAVYRNIEVTFIASNALTVLTFSGQGLQDIGDESWGIDNVGVRLTSELAGTFIRSTSLPPDHSTNSAAIDSFIVSANAPLLAASATDSANYSLREAGANGVLGDGDDVVVSLTPSLPGAGGRSVSLAIADSPLPPGHYRFQTTTGLEGTNGSPVPAYTRFLVIASPMNGAIETANNNTLDTATALPTTESPAGSGFLTAFAVGLFASTSDVDYWHFDAEAGDVVTVRLESESQGVYPHLRLRDATDRDVASADGDSGGVVQLQQITLSSPGTYYLRVWSSNNRSRYWMRLDQSRGPQMETEDNGSQGNANLVNITFSPGLYQGRMAGALPTADSAGDFFRLGTLNVGNAISVTALYPVGSTLTPGQTILSVQLDGNPVALVTNTTGNLNYTIVSNGVHYVHVESANRGLRAQYLLNISGSDGVPPLVTGTSLPDAGATTTGIIDRFTLTFSEDIYAPAIGNSANYELRGAGPDGSFGTGDDRLYTVVSTGYSSGLESPYAITDGPLQPGQYRFTVRTGILDRAGNNMAAPFVRNFTVANLGNYVIENRNNDAAGWATSLSAAPLTNADGTVGWISNVSTASRPHGMAAGRFNADTYLDLVTANWDGDNVTILTNNGAGLFTAVTNIPTGNNPLAVGVGDFSGDGKADLAVANYNGGSVTILLGDGNASFQVLTNLTGFSNPYNLAVADLNGDGRPDLAVPNAGSDRLTVLLGNGNGTFQVLSNYTTGDYPQTVSAGDLNGDGRLDLAVANYNSGTVTIFLGNGTGSFQTETNLPAGPNPRYLVIGDVTGDGRPDIVTMNSGDNTVSVLVGNGDGTFQSRRFYYDGTTDAYQ
ncbi:MAG: FG-GAP-like repeat-containing protein, partial [Candidatus Omnitrophica bacterium]|nr:FG-GAP-like repeat-containing protein [Candidatus Omnitrophota bacterium]